MQFPTVTFAFFFVIVLGVNALLGARNPTMWKLGLVAANAVFYAWWDPRYLLLLGAVVVGSHLAAWAMAKWPTRGRAAMAAGIAGDLVVLGFFKYYGFFAEGLRDALEPVGLEPSLPLLNVVLPIGVSFYVFESIAYLVEVRRKVVDPVPLLDLTVHLSFFPKLLSGPITRPSEFVPQLTARADVIEAPRAMWLVARGLLKKMVVASYLADHLTDDVFASPGQHSGAEVLVAVYGYAAQLYVDFSAYTDMALGLALLLGFRLPENFDRPYAATSVQDFWSRWHMTLSRWFRDFVFQPLALGGRRGTWATVRNIMIVMILTGLWHGAAWTFVVWGGSHGVVMAGERVRRERRRAKRKPKMPETTVGQLARQLATFHFIAFTWVLFRADSLGHAGEVYTSLANSGGVGGVSVLFIAVVAATIAMQYLPPTLIDRPREAFPRLAPAFQVLLIGGALLTVDALGPEGVAPFIYFGF